MKRFALLLACVAACRPAVATPIVSLAEIAPSAVVVVAAPKTETSSTIVVTGAPYAGRALWSVRATGRVEAVPFPWAKLSNIDSLVVSPDGRNVAYVEGGTAFGPFVVRALANGSKEVALAHEPGREILVLAWSPDGRKVLYATRRAGEIQPSCHLSGCPGHGPSSYFVFDRTVGHSAKIDVPDELATWLPSGEVIVTDDDGGIARVDHGTKNPVGLATHRHGDFALDVVGNRLLSTGWNETTKRDEVLALDLATWNEAPIAPPAPYATYLWPCASRSGKRIAWLATTFGHHEHSEALVVDGKTLVAPARDLVGFAWIDDDAIVAHYEDRIDVLDANDGKLKGSQVTGANDTMP